METSGLLLRIIGKGGLIGACAQMYLADEKRRNIFLQECFEQIHNESLRVHLGEQLATDLIKFNEIYLEKQGICKKKHDF